MDKMESMPDRAFMLGALFIAANRVETQLEREFQRYGITVKQWFLAIVLVHLFPAPPTISETARVMGSSHQNIKQLALALNRKGLLDFLKDEQDSRMIRLRLSEQGAALREKVRSGGNAFQTRLFNGIGDEELKAARSVLSKILLNIDEIENTIVEGK